MCTVVLLRRAGHRWPLLLAANRDEMLSRKALTPGRHWPDYSDIVAGRDLDAGGTWLGVNDHGVIAAILNRRGSLGPASGMRSRGEIPLAALAHETAADAAAALLSIDGRRYRPFNLIIADSIDAYWLYKREDGEAIERTAVPMGLSMVTAAELNDPTSPRIQHFLPLFRRASPPRPEIGNWLDWQVLLASNQAADSDDPLSAMTVATSDGFATVSSSLIALPHETDTRPIWLYADGRPDETPFVSIAL